MASYVHVHSLRTRSGEEVLVCRALGAGGRTGFGFSFALEATEARHMALHALGERAQRPVIEPRLGHPWETAWLEGRPVPWEDEPAFREIRWLPGA